MFNFGSDGKVATLRTEIQANTPPLAHLGRSEKKRLFAEGTDLGLGFLGYV